jgi:predicted nucleotidyltransferase
MPGGGMPLPKGIALHYHEQQGLQGIIRDLTERYPAIRAVVLYGSKARGDFAADSDLDLLFVVDGPVSRSERDQMFDLIGQHELAHDLVVSALFVPVSDYQEKVSVFLMRVRKEGVLLWSRE